MRHTNGDLDGVAQTSFHSSGRKRDASYFPNVIPILDEIFRSVAKVPFNICRSAALKQGRPLRQGRPAALGVGRR